MSWSGPLVEKHDRDLKPPYTRNGEIHRVDNKGKHLSTGIEASDIDGDGKPAPRWKLWYAKGMLGWAVISHTFLLLQAIKIYSEKNASGVSLPAYILYLVGAIVWIVYGAFVLQRRNLVIVLSSSIAFLGGLTILIGIILYGNNEKDCSAEIKMAMDEWNLKMTETT